MSDNPTISLLGAALDTGNLGVQALGLATLFGLRRRLPRARIVLFSDRPGHRDSCWSFETDEGRFEARYEEIGASLSRNPFKPGNLHRENVLGRIGFGKASGVVSRTLAESDLILDFSGGDSFTTLYGPHRYRYTTAPRRLARRWPAPYVMMPQTYGPFDALAEVDARELLQSSARIWSRDLAGRKTVARLLGRHASELCPDVAFALPADSFEEQPPSGVLRIGLNVSGLLFNGRPARVRERFRLAVDYRVLMHEIAMCMLSTASHAELLLIPHVLIEHTSEESDIRACADLCESLPDAARARTRIATVPASACAAKGLIARCDYFIGTRMHACIAALSSGVPACAIAYSDKTSGVFESVGMAHAVLDARILRIDSMLERIEARFVERERDAKTLGERIPQSIDRINLMFDDLLEILESGCRARAA